MVFKIKLEGVMLGESSERQQKDANGRVISVKNYVKVEFIGGFLEMEVDKTYMAELKRNIQGTAVVSMEPEIIAKHVVTKDKREYDFVESGFTNYKLIGFETPSK